MKQKKSTDTFFNIFLKSFFQGLLIIGPLGLTISVVWYIISSVDSLVPSIGEKFPGLVFLLAIIFTAILGYFVNKFVLGKFIFDQIDHLLESTPGVKHIYTPTKDVMASFVGDKKKFNNPVWVRTNENPTIWRIGFLTQQEMDIEVGDGFVAVYLPHSYAISGWVVITERYNIKPIENMDAATAMKFAVSGGVAGFHKNEHYL